MTLRPNDASSKTILITVDLEDWFQVENLRPVFPLSTWNSQELRIEHSTHTLLDLFDRHHIQATFFVLGWLAEKCPSLIRTIQGRGHEVASHGYNHHLCSELSPSDLHDDVLNSKTIVENITGQPVLGYRAPNFSISNELMIVLGNLGFKYDSSYNNFALNKRHGKADGLFDVSIGNRFIAVNGLVELPVSNLSFAGISIPWSGGGYFRFWPSTLFHAGVNRILKNSDHYMFYCHPWEVDPEQPRTDGVGPLSRFRHYLNLDQTLNRLNRFFTVFKDCNFISCSNYLNL